MSLVFVPLARPNLLDLRGAWPSATSGVRQPILYRWRSEDRSISAEVFDAGRSALMWARRGMPGCSKPRACAAEAGSAVRRWISTSFCQASHGSAVPVIPAPRRLPVHPDPAGLRTSVGLIVETGEPRDPSFCRQRLRSEAIDTVSSPSTLLRAPFLAAASRVWTAAKSSLCTIRRW